MLPFKSLPIYHSVILTAHETDKMHTKFWSKNLKVKTTRKI